MRVNRYLFDRLEGIRQTWVAQGRSGDLLADAAKGDEREIFIRDFLGTVFPPHFRFGQGQITDSNGERSGQIDIAVELPFFPSFTASPSNARLYLAEGVAAVVEVKSNIAAQWPQVESTTTQVRKLSRKYRSSFSRGHMSRRIPIYAVGYTGYRSVESAKRRFDETESCKCPDGVLVLDQGIFVGENDIIARGAWALFALIVLLNDACTRLVSTNPDLLAYAGEGTERY